MLVTMEKEDLVKILSWAKESKEANEDQLRLLLETKRCYSMICELLHGDEERADSWMVSKNTYLNHISPLQMIFINQSQVVFKKLESFLIK